MRRRADGKQPDGESSHTVLPSDQALFKGQVGGPVMHNLNSLCRVPRGDHPLHETWHDGQSPLSRKAGTPLLQQASISAVAEGYRPLKNKDNDQSRQLASYTNQLQSKLRVIREESIKRRGVREPFRSGYLVAGDRVFPGSIELRFIPSANTVYRSESSSGEPDDKTLSEQTGCSLGKYG
ncbi:hypothetical protein DTO027B5_2350 [Paecilomyces variotii]|nr:hypothetical protein DTO021C3_223 [Paecilomyces variotii]KAJ9320112.1 hypothetical protein DTO027B3_8860 [Paecilomyces variotii]KAJ9336035.1 hypothetical protein DTO027B5_2350 [Paecilomyces variotii]